MDGPSARGPLPGGAGGTVSRSTNERTLKNRIRSHRNTYWCIPAKESGSFVACIEDVHDIYERPYDPEYPVVCVYELPYELHEELRDPLLARPGNDTKRPTTSTSGGTCSVFEAIEPLTGRCLVKARERRTKNLAEFTSKIAETSPDAKRIVLVWDNLNTHNAGSFYDAFSPDKAQNLASRFDSHNTEAWQLARCREDSAQHHHEAVPKDKA